MTNTTPLRHSFRESKNKVVGAEVEHGGSRERGNSPAHGQRR